MLVALPLLKLILMGRRDRLSFLDVWFLLLTSFLGMATVTFLCMDLYGYHQLKEQRDDQLIVVSQQLLRNFKNEVHDILKQLTILDNQKHNPEVTPDSQKSEERRAMTVRKWKRQTRGECPT